MTRAEREELLGVIVQARQALLVGNLQVAKNSISTAEYIVRVTAPLKRI